MNANQIADSYLDGLGRKDLDQVLSLFDANGLVSSPLYGELPASEFYPQLFSDSQSSTLTLKGVTTGKSVEEDQELVSIWFHFAWTLANGEPADFDVVDVLEIDRSGLIRKLHIIYDTFELRDSFQRSQSLLDRQ